MKKYLICMDVSGDIDKGAAKDFELMFIPMEYSFKDDMRLCENIEEDAVLKEFYDGQRNGALTKTTQINPYMYETYFDKPMKKGYSILYLSLSSGLSTTYLSACEAKKTLKEKYPEVDLFVVDTLSATGGMGILCERAFRNRENGFSIEENYNDLIEVRKNVNCWFMVQDLMYLKRGGRIGAGTAVIGTMLNIKPVLRIDKNGKLITTDKKKGNTSAVSELCKMFGTLNLSMFDNDAVYIIDADAPELGDKLEQFVKIAKPSVTIRRRMLSPIIGAHTGPGMAAVCFMGKEQQ